MSKPRLLFHSNAPWAPTGYGQQTALFCPRLAEHYDLGISSFWGLEGNRLMFGKIPVYPSIGGDFGNETLIPHAKTHFGGLRDGLVLTLMDVWVLDPRIVRKLNMACWVPVDHDPAPPEVRSFFAESGAIPVAMSRFGEAKLEEFDPLYVPHGCDTKVYQPIDKAEAREVTKIPQDAFVVGMVAANKGNPSRKCFAEALRAFKAFRDRHSDAVLYLHTELKGRFQGVNIPALINAVGLPGDAVLFADQGRMTLYPFPADVMAQVYSSLDVLLLPSAGEGFGLPVLEANACGVPAIVTDFTAQPEVNGAGWSVEYTPTYTQQMSWQAKPDIEDIVESLEHCYRLPEASRQMLSDKARRHALQYDADRVMQEHFLPALKQVHERFEARNPVAVAV